MKIKLIHVKLTEGVASAIANHFHNSRFKLFVSWAGGTINLSKIRLNQSKAYCGNHAKACEGPHNTKHAKRRFLEGADWVDFNDQVNTVLDHFPNDQGGLGVESYVSSVVCVIRIGSRRRIRYEANSHRGVPGQPNFEWVWDKHGPEDHFGNYCGKLAPPSWFPEGTPGIYESIGYCVVG